jgi:hypothetical protein
MESIPRSTTHPIITLNPPEFNVTNDDNKFVFVGKVYGRVNINADMEKVYKLLENFSTYNEKELLNNSYCSNGIYTWLIYSNEESDQIKFAATQVLSPYEIGTNHQSIAYNKKVNASLIYGAGELKKSNNLITFNLISGTYTKKIVQYDFTKTKKDIIVNKFLEFFNSELTQDHFKIVFDEYRESCDSYIHSVNTVSNKLLELYKINNYIVRIFDINNECIHFNNDFWHIDWTIEYYKKKLDNATDNEKDLMLKLYMQSLESMNKLIK